ncbi:30S ribosomal protein S17e [Methanosarcinales archaeon]|nr:MAG: 30S ribosomal protein S17e [Methanosarcinales archaeon]
MGNVRPNYIKTVGENLLRTFKDDFTGDFDENKELVRRYTNVKSKTIRNRIAGYITSRINGERRREHRMRGEDEAYA